MEESTVTHISANSKYRMVIERAASTKGVDGFKVEANDDVLELVKKQVEDLYAYAHKITQLNVQEVK